MEILKNIKSEDLLMVSFGKSTGEIKSQDKKIWGHFSTQYILDNKAFHKNMNSSEVFIQIDSLISNEFKECILYSIQNDINIFRNKKNE